jgi:replicative DNA helicase
MIPDKLPPQSIEAEEAVIGTLLAYPESINNVIAILSPEMFYTSKLQSIFRCCLEVNKKYETLDMITVNTELKKKGIDDKIIYLTELSGRIMTNQMIEIHAMLIKEMYLKREYIKLANEIADSAYRDDLADTVAKAETGLLNLSGKLHTREPKLLGLIVDDALDLIEKINKKEIQLFGVPSGFSVLDRITSGFNKKELTIIAGRPSIGKTALALQIAKNTAGFHFPVGIFSCEMSQFQQAVRFLSGVSGFTNTELRSGRCDMDHLRETSESLQQLGIYIDDTSAISLIELRAKTRKLILRYGIKLMIVDYLQLMSGSGKKQNREQTVSELSAGLKSIAVDIDIPIIALSQLNRLAEDRADKRPQLRDLRESGAIEQDADLVILIHRPAVYGIKYITDTNNKEKSTDGLIILDLAKNRNGATGELILQHNISMTLIKDEN